MRRLRRGRRAQRGKFSFHEGFTSYTLRILHDHDPARAVGGVRDNGGVQGYRDDGVVLRTQKLGEADRIITLLTRHNGRVRAVARGIRRTKSRFGGAA